MVEICIEIKVNLNIHLVQSTELIRRFKNIDWPSRLEHLVRHAQTLVLLSQLIHFFQFLWRELNLHKIFYDPRILHRFRDRNMPSGFRPSKPRPEA